jgi:hypothetical protein
MNPQENAALAKYLQMISDSFTDVHRRLGILEYLVAQNPALAAEYEAAKGAKIPITPSGLPTQLQAVLQSMNSR